MRRRSSMIPTFLCQKKLMVSIVYLPSQGYCILVRRTHFSKYIMFFLTRYTSFLAFQCPITKATHSHNKINTMDIDYQAVIDYI